MAVKQIGQATSSAVAVGGWQLAWRRCGGVDGAGWGAVVGEVVCMLSAGGCEVDGFFGGTGHHAHRAQSPKDQSRGSPTQQREIHWRVSILWWVARAHFFFGFGFPPLVTRLLFLFF